MSVFTASKTPPPLPNQPRGVLTCAQARNCLLANQFGTPGLGSLMARRWLVGTGQIVVFLIGFGLFVFWFVLTMRDYYRLVNNPDLEPVAHGSLAWLGVALAFFAWCWAWFTSIDLVRTARANEVKRGGH